MQPEIQVYFRQLADEYDIPSHVKFESQVLGAQWDNKTATWVVDIEDLKTKRRYTKRCKILISSVGALSVPKKCEIPGAENFKGRLFHSAEWDHTFDWKGKRVVTIGMFLALLHQDECVSLIFKNRQRMQRHTIRPSHERRQECGAKNHSIRPSGPLAF